MSPKPVGEIIQRTALVIGAPDRSVREAAESMAEHSCGSILVVSKGRLLGIFTERDLLIRVVAKGKDPARTTLADVMTRDPEAIAADAPVAEAIRRMDEGSFRYLPIIRGDKLVGVISAKDLPYAEIAGMAGEIDQRHALTEHMR
jgi:CBS domain-containing protein